MRMRRSFLPLCSRFVDEIVITFEKKRGQVPFLLERSLVIITNAMKEMEMELLYRILRRNGWSPNDRRHKIYSVLAHVFALGLLWSVVVFVPWSFNGLSAFACTMIAIFYFIIIFQHKNEKRLIEKHGEEIRSLMSNQFIEHTGRNTQGDPENIYISHGQNADLIEKTPAYLRVVEEVEEEAGRQIADQAEDLGACHLFWAAKSEILKKKHNINWRSPAELNSGIRYD